MKGGKQRAEHEQNGRAWLAWHTAFLPYAKKKPRLRDLLVSRPKPRKQSADEQIAIARQWTAIIEQMQRRG